MRSALDPIRLASIAKLAWIAGTSDRLSKLECGRSCCNDSTACRSSRMQNYVRESYARNPCADLTNVVPGDRVARLVPHVGSIRIPSLLTLTQVVRPSGSFSRSLRRYVGFVYIFTPSSRDYLLLVTPGAAVSLPVTLAQR